MPRIPQCPGAVYSSIGTVHFEISVPFPEPHFCVNEDFPIVWNGSSWDFAWGPSYASIEPRGTVGSPIARINWALLDCEAGGFTDLGFTCGQLMGGQTGGWVMPPCCGLEPGQGTASEVIATITPWSGPISTPPELPETCPRIEPGPCCPIERGGPSSGGPINAALGSGCQGCHITSQLHSGAPVRYASGELAYAETDILASGFGMPWGHTRSFSSRLTPAMTNGNGFNWLVSQWPYVSVDYFGNIAIVGKPSSTLWFTKLEDGSYVEKFGGKQSLSHDALTDRYSLVEHDGTETLFDEHSGLMRKVIAPGGMTIEVKSLAPNGIFFQEVERSCTEGGNTTVEQLYYVYDSSLGDPVLTSVTLRRKVNASAWNNVLRAVYTYYDYDEDFGDYEDLKTATTQEWDGSAWQDTGTSHYRYYKQFPTPPSGSSSSSSAAPSSSSGSPVQDPRWRSLMYVVGPAAFERLKADPGVVDPLTAPDSLVALYADYYFEYDEDRRVTKEMIQGGSQTYLFDYSESVFADDWNQWKYKTVETLPDGNQNVVYMNYAGRSMLEVFKSGLDEWATFYEYDENGRVVLRANPSAVTGYDEAEPDLLNFNVGTGKYQYLRDSAGLVRTFTYHAPSGYLASESLQEGQLGTSIKLRELEYVACGCGSGSSSSSSSSSGSPGACGDGNVWFTAKETVYPSDVDPNDKNVTTYAYTFHPGTCQPQEIVTTLPAIPTSQNGSGVAATRRDYFDIYGRNTWRMNERGFIDRMKPDVVTGALVQSIQDVDTGIETDAPSGWTTPSGGGLNLVTDYEFDDRGRMTQSLGPTHTIDLAGVATAIRRAQWTVYDESGAFDVQRSAAGYATGSSPSYDYMLVNPVAISIVDKSGKPQEQIQAVRASTDGKLLPTDEFEQSDYVRWTTIQYTDCCSVASQRIYFDIPASGAGTEGTNYDEAEYGYDVLKRRNRSVTGGGTIERLVFDARGNVVERWIGTNDFGATASDPSGGGATGNNMVIVEERIFDAGNDGGDGHLTRQIEYVSGTDNRVTDFVYDFRGRQTEIDGEIDFFQKDYYDNFDRVTRTEQYDTTSSGNLVALSETFFDRRGRVYRTKRWGVDPSTGTVGNALTDNSWFDPVGLRIKSLPAGSKVFEKTAHDSLNRPIATYRGYDLDEATYAEAGSVTDDVILEQSETTYDGASNATLAIMRQRYHNAPATQTGELQDASTSPKARVTYATTYPDAIGRLQASVDFGTNGGSALSRPSTVPAPSDTVLVTGMTYDDAGNAVATTDPSGKVDRMEYDDAGRQVRQIQNYVASSSSSSSSGSSSGDCPDSDDVNVTVATAYNADGNVASVTAVNASTGNQTTQYVYGTTLVNSEIASSLLLREEIYPDSASSSDVVRYEYDRQSARTKMTDQAGTVHEYDYDKLGRPTQDRATTLGPNIDGAVRRIGHTYEVRGMVEKITSYDDPTVGSGSVINETQYQYNDFAQVVILFQEQWGAVNVSTSPKVGYSYADGSANKIRLETLVYPNGRELTYDYGSSGGIDDAISRVKSLVDNDVASTHLADYAYLGLGTFVECDYTEPDVKWTMIDLAGSNDPDTGDIYSGFDRFGRIKDNRWRDYGSSTDVDRLKYGYDRASSRIWRENVVATSLGKRFDELYSYDGVHRLKDMQRGTLNGSKTAVTNETFAECWSLDATGNWQQYRQNEDGGATSDLVQSRTTNAANEIVGISETTGPAWATPVYDAAGNMTTIPQVEDPTQTYLATWDAWNRLVKLEEPDGSGGWRNLQENTFDGQHWRTSVCTYVNGTLNETRRYVHSARWQILEEHVLYDSAFEVDRQWFWGLRYIDDVLLRDRATAMGSPLDERLFCISDANWNVVGILASSGHVAQRFAYSSYGDTFVVSPGFHSEPATHAWNRLYASYETDLASGLLCVRRRFYCPSLGNWVSRDPYDDALPQDLYQYAHSNPLNATDPLGLMIQFPPVAGAVLIAVAIVVARVVVFVVLTAASITYWALVTYLVYKTYQKACEAYRVIETLRRMRRLSRPRPRTRTKRRRRGKRWVCTISNWVEDGKGNMVLRRTVYKGGGLQNSTAVPKILQRAIQ